MVAAHTDLTAEERELIDDVFDAGDTELREVMIPRTEVAFLDASLPAFRAASLVAQMPHSRYPVIGDSPDDVLGFVHVRDILTPSMVDRSVRLEDLAREVAFFPGSKQVIPALTEMRRGGHHLAVVADEYGGTAGIVTLEDLVEELVGDIHDEYDQAGQRPDARPAHGCAVRGRRAAQPRGLRGGVRGRAAGRPLRDGRRVVRRPARAAAGDRRPSCRAPVPGFEVIELDGRRISRLRVDPGDRPSAGPARRRPDRTPRSPLTAAAGGGPEPSGGRGCAGDLCDNVGHVRTDRASCPASSRPPTPSTSATTWGRCATGCRCRRPTTASTASWTCTRSRWSTIRPRCTAGPGVALRAAGGRGDRPRASPRCSSRATCPSTRSSSGCWPA